MNALLVADGGRKMHVIGKKIGIKMKHRKLDLGMPEVTEKRNQMRN